MHHPKRFFKMWLLNLYLLISHVCFTKKHPSPTLDLDAWVVFLIPPNCFIFHLENWSSEISCSAESLLPSSYCEKSCRGHWTKSHYETFTVSGWWTMYETAGRDVLKYITFYWISVVSFSCFLPEPNPISFH